MSKFNKICRYSQGVHKDKTIQKESNGSITRMGTAVKGKFECVKSAERQFQQSETNAGKSSAAR